MTYSMFDDPYSYTLNTAEQPEINTVVSWGVGGNDILVAVNHFEGKVSFISLSYTEAERFIEHLTKAIRKVKAIEEDYMRYGAGYVQLNMFDLLAEQSEEQDFTAF